VQWRTVSNMEPGKDQSRNLAVRYRPRSFATVIGQGHVVEVLRRAVAGAAVPQQILFSGGSGLGKTTIARIVAAAMLCETPLGERERGDACGTCRSCADAANNTHPDIIEFDAASHGGKDEIRDIAARAQVLPLRSAAKVYIVDEAHGLSNAGGQAFLKLLEEPPAHVVFMLCTTDPQKMLKTNRGRCVEFELLPPTRHEVAANLERIAANEGWTVPSGVLDAVIDSSDPELGVRGTVTTFAKLATVLGDSRPPSPDMVASLLGTPSPTVMRRLDDAVAKGDRADALRSLDQARRVSPDGAIRSALLRTARANVQSALDTDADLDVALWRLELLLRVGDRPGDLDVAVAKLAAPLLDGPAGLPAVLTRVEELLAAGPAAPAVAAEPAGSPSPSPGLARLLAAASPAPPEIHALLPRCEVIVSDSEVTVIAPDEIVPALNPLVPVLRTAAGRLGLPLKLRKKSTMTGA
jgi:DNA polymerase III subunit gamma/tau